MQRRFNGFRVMFTFIILSFIMVLIIAVILIVVIGSLLLHLTIYIKWERNEDHVNIV